MRLNRLFIEHFKGIEKLEIKPNGKNITVRGENGTGKTTIADAYAWALTGKGVDGSKIDGQIKKRDERGNCPNDGGVEHTVEVELEDDNGQPLKISRHFVEKWEKRRGDAESEFTGNTVKYAINDVPMQKGEFEKRLAEVCDESAFRLLSIPLSFCSMKWQDRRKTLMTIVGNISQADVITSDPALAPLTELLKDKSVEDLRKVLKAQITKTNEAMKGIPSRIDELQLMVTEPEGQPQAALHTEYTSLTAQKSELERKLLTLTNGGAVAELQKKLALAEAKLLKVIADFEAENRNSKQNLEDKARGCRTRIETLGDDMERLTKKRSQLEAMIETADKQMAKLREKWADVNGEKPDFENIDVCPHCGQTLPADKLEETKQHILEAFNEAKAKKLMDINATGKRIKAAQAKDAESRQNVIDQMTTYEAELGKVSEKLADIEQQIALSDYTAKLEENPGYLSAKSQVDEIQREMERLGSDNTIEAEKIKQDIKALELDISSRAEKLASFDLANKTKQRIEDLKAEEKALGQTYSALQAQMTLTDMFIEAEVSMTESSINSHFKFVHWKMFERQINGGLRPCCEPLIDGVPFWDGLNKGNRMKAALDILNTLGQHYEKTLPIIIDDCESYTSLIPVDSQIIRLIADKNYKSLDVEVEN